MVSNKSLRFILVLLICLVLISPLGIFYARNYLKFEVSFSSLLSDQQFKLENSPYSQSLVFNYLEDQVPENHCVLVFRQAEIAYYQRKCTVSYLDPRLIDAYTGSKQEALIVLKELSVSHVAAPVDYGMAEINHSPFAALLSDPSIATIAIDTNSIRVYKLNYDSNHASQIDSIVQSELTESDLSVIGGKLAPKHYYTGGGSLFSPPKNYSENTFEQRTEIAVDVELHGNGFYRLMGVDYEQILNSDPSEWILRKFLVWEGLVDDVKNISARIVRPENSSSLFRFSIQGKKGEDLSPISYLTTKHYPNIYKGNLAWQRAIENRWWLWANPHRSFEYVDWGFKSFKNDALMGSLPNDRQFFIGKLLPKTLNNTWLKLVAQPSGIKPNFFVQWLSNRSPQVPFLYKIESSWFGLRENSAIEKAMGGTLLKHLLPVGFDSKYVSHTQLLNSSDISDGICIEVPSDADSSRVVLVYSVDNESSATSLREFQVDNFSASYSTANECSTVN